VHPGEVARAGGPSPGDNLVRADVVVDPNGAWDPDKVRVLGKYAVSIDVAVLKGNRAGIRTLEAGRVEGNQIVKVGWKGIPKKYARPAIRNNRVVHHQRTSSAGRRWRVHRRCPRH